jgi:GNAT superfamily N-acetyltransferase
MVAIRLTPFPAARDDCPATPTPLLRRGFSLRPLQHADHTWLRDLYASTRQAEMAAVPWDAASKRAFLDQQFFAQHQHYLAHFADADFLAIEHAQHGPVGRYYLQRQAPMHLIVDICLLPALRGQGVGHALIGHSQQSAAAHGCGMRLHVLDSNVAAQRLYARLGFTAGLAEGHHRAMHWQP